MITLSPKNALNSIAASHTIQAESSRRAFNRLHYLKSHPNAQKQFGRIAVVKHSFQYSIVGTNGSSFITAFSGTASVLLSDMAPATLAPLLRA